MQAFKSGPRLIWLSPAAEEMVHSRLNAPYGAKCIAITSRRPIIWGWDQNTSHKLQVS